MKQKTSRFHKHTVADIRTCAEKRDEWHDGGRWEMSTYIPLGPEFALFVKTGADETSSRIFEIRRPLCLFHFLFQMTEGTDCIRHGKDEAENDEIGNESHSTPEIVSEYLSSDEFANKSRQRQHEDRRYHQFNHQQHEHCHPNHRRHLECWAWKPLRIPHFLDW